LAYDPAAPHETRLYHITDVANLPAIIEEGLLSDQRMAERGGPLVGIGYSNIKHRRMHVLQVDCVADRFVGEFVPFYFCPRSVMLYTVNQGNVDGRPKGCQKSIVHLVTTVGDLVDLGHDWAFSDRGANTMVPPNFWNNLARLDRLDWEAIGSTYWGARGPQKAAEFLVADVVPWIAIRHIACFDDGVRDHVRQLVADMEDAPSVSTRRNWYFP
jgi:hypothetical protein